MSRKFCLVCYCCELASGLSVFGKYSVLTHSLGVFWRNFPPSSSLGSLDVTGLLNSSPSLSRNLVFNCIGVSPPPPRNFPGRGLRPSPSQTAAWEIHGRYSGHERPLQIDLSLSAIWPQAIGFLRMNQQPTQAPVWRDIYIPCSLSGSATACLS